MGENRKQYSQEKADIDVDLEGGWIRFRQARGPLSIKQDHVDIPILVLKSLFAALLQQEVMVLSGGQMRQETKQVAEVSGPKLA